MSDALVLLEKRHRQRFCRCRERRQRRFQSRRESTTQAARPRLRQGQMFHSATFALTRGFIFLPTVKKRIVEQLIKLPVSRQRKWQLRQKQKGLCQKCSKPAAPASVFCIRHMVAHRVAARRRYEPKRGRTHQYRKTKSYRLAAAAQGDLRQLRPSDVQELLNSRWL